jgi:hypothetical protein
MTSRVAKPACRWVGAMFLALALAGLIDGPAIGRHGFIVTDAGLNILHAMLGLFLLGFSFGGESTAAFGLYASAAVCFIFAAFALYDLGSYDVVKISDDLALTRSAAYMHLVSAFIMSILGKMNTASKQLFRE